MRIIHLIRLRRKHMRGRLEREEEEEEKQRGEEREEPFVMVKR